MIRLIAYSPLEGAAFYESEGKTFHTVMPFTPSVTEEVPNAQELAEMTMGYFDGQGRTVANFEELKRFLGSAHLNEIQSNESLPKNRQLLDEVRSRVKSKTAVVSASTLDEKTRERFLQTVQELEHDLEMNATRMDAIELEFLKGLILEMRTFNTSTEFSKNLRGFLARLASRIFFAGIEIGGAQIVEQDSKGHPIR